MSRESFFNAGENPQEKKVVAAPPQQEREVPELNVFEQKFNWLFYILGRVTHESTLGTQSERKEGIERSLLTRSKRAELLKKLRALPKNENEKRKNIIEEAHSRDRIAKEYFLQREMSVDISGLGIQKSRCVIIEPNYQKEPHRNDKNPPIFLIPGLANDIDAVGALVQEIAYKGRKVIVAGYPESALGTVTKEFTESVEQSTSYQTHATYFKELMKHFMGEDEAIELWSYSTGCPVAAEIMTDQEMSKVIKNSVLVAPAGSVEQSIKKLYAGVVYEAGLAAKRFGDLSMYSFGMGKREPETDEQGKLKKRVFSSMLQRISRKANFWRDTRVSPGGKIVVWSGGKDQITKSREAEQEFLQNPQMTSIIDPGGSHMTPLLEAGRIIDEIFEKD